VCVAPFPKRCGRKYARKSARQRCVLQATRGEGEEGARAIRIGYIARAEGPARCEAASVAEGRRIWLVAAEVVWDDDWWPLRPVCLTSQAPEAQTDSGGRHDDLSLSALFNHAQ
jgi:hypothetical protein